jgi:hypothetical protein
MTNLVPVPSWDEVVRLETTTQALAGPSGPMNVQAQALLNRTAELKEFDEAIGSNVGSTYVGHGGGTVSDALTVLTAGVAAGNTSIEELQTGQVPNVDDFVGGLVGSPQTDGLAGITFKLGTDYVNRSLKDRYLDFVNVEDFRKSGFTDAQTIQAAVNSGKALDFPERTYTITTGESIINNTCHVWRCWNTTFKIANGAIVNTNASRGNFTPFMRTQGVQGFSLLGSWTADGNRDNQTYPTTNSDFGRGATSIGAAGRRTNAIFEFTPATDNTTPCRNIYIENGLVKNAYLNGLVFWQCENVLVNGVRTQDSAVNGIAGGGCTNFTAINCSHLRDGASDAYPTTVLPTGFGDRAGIQFREILPTFTAALLLIPSIPITTYAQINRNINIVDCKAEDCGVESWFIRACFPGRIHRCSSRNVGYKRLAGVDTNGDPFFSPAHVWAEMGQYELDFVAYQDKVTDPLWMSPMAVVCFSFSGNGYTSSANPMAIAGDFTSTVRGKAMCTLTSAGAKQNNFSKGALLTSCVNADLEIEGCVGDPITIINDANFNLQPPHDVHLRAKVWNCQADRAVLVTRFAPSSGTVTGPASNIHIELDARDIRSTLSGTDDHALVDVSTTMANYVMDNFRAVNLVLDGTNTAGNFNGVRLRCNAATKNVRINYIQCTNMISALRTQGFRNMIVDGVVETCYRAWLIDLASSGSDTEEFDMTGLRTYDILVELFSLIGATTRKIKVFKASGALLKARTTVRTWSTASTVTTTDDNYFAELGKFFFDRVVHDYGSSSPATLITDMRRKFTDATTLAAATPMYAGEIVRRSDNSSVYVARSTAVGDFSLMA